MEMGHMIVFSGVMVALGLTNFPAGLKSSWDMGKTTRKGVCILL